MRSLEQWAKYFENDGNAEKHLQALLSDTLTTNEKVHLMWLAQRHIKGLGDKSEFMENKLNPTRLAQ